MRASFNTAALRFRATILTSLLLIIPATGLGEELSDIDVEMIVELADGVWKGDVVSIQEIKVHVSTTEVLAYRNAKVMVVTQNGSIRSFRASKIDGDWRLDNEEAKRLESLQKYRAQREEAKQK